MNQKNTSKEMYEWMRKCREIDRKFRNVRGRSKPEYLNPAKSDPKNSYLWHLERQVSRKLMTHRQLVKIMSLVHDLTKDGEWTVNPRKLWWAQNSVIQNKPNNKINDHKN